MFKLRSHNNVQVKYHKKDKFNNYLLMDNSFGVYYEIIIPNNVKFRISKYKKYFIRKITGYYVINVDFENFLSSVISINDHYFRPFNDVHTILYKHGKFCFYPLNLKTLPSKIENNQLYYGDIKIYTFNDEIPIIITSNDVRGALIKHLVN